MSDYQCGDNAALVGYVYDECEAAERAAIGAHVAVCGACAAELAALESTRIQLRTWSPPDAALGFLITRREPSETPAARASASVLRPPRWLARPMPAWVQMAAAVTIFAAGLSLGVARGLAPAAAPPQARAATPPPPSSQGVSPDQLAALEQRLRAEISQSRQVPAASASTGDGQLLARVRALIDESEQRQQRELALRTAEIIRDFDSQRRLDLAQIQRSFGQIEGVTGAEVRQQRQMLDYLIRVSQQR